MKNSDAKVVAIISYVTLVGWIVAIVLHNNNRSELGAYHLRQSLGLMLTMAVLWFIPIIGWILNIVLFIFLIIGLVYASQEEQKPVPVVGEFYQNLFKGIN
ncbi:MAG: DUF4870 domain-containing protein [Bacteroidales bacterium]